MPLRYSVQPISHRKFDGMWCCRISVALEETYFIVDKNGTVDCFPTFEAAFSAGSRALITILNKRIVVPKKPQPKASEVIQTLKRSDAPDIEFGFFGGYD
jgi:hypothetical protein